VIIPMLNEARELPHQIPYWRDLEKSGAQVIVVDGGSIDHSPELVRQAGITLVASKKRGRSFQMNQGAKVAQGEIYLFLHADTRLPAGAVEIVGERLDSYVWGRFDVSITGSSRILPFVSWMINLRSRLTGIATGDQAIFVKREAFWGVGGFPSQPLMEDIEISKRLRKWSPPCCLEQQVRTSGRRWEVKGVWRTIFLMWWLRGCYWCGVSPQRLVKLYAHL
jgi:rSAM/selenodomain-associated transferase 2